MDVEETPVLPGRENIMVSSPLPCRSHKSGMIPHRHHRHPGNREIWPNMIWVGGGGSILWESPGLPYLPVRRTGKPQHCPALIAANISSDCLTTYNVSLEVFASSFIHVYCLVQNYTQKILSWQILFSAVRKHNMSNVITCRGDNLD